MELFITILIVSIVTLFLYFKHTFSYWEKRGVITIKPVIPFGNLKDFILQRSTLGEELSNAYKKLKAPGVRFFGFYFFTRPDIIIADPELAKTILTREFASFADRGLNYHEKNDPLSATLLSLNGTDWKVMRQKLTPTFSSGKIRQMFKTIIDCSDGLEYVLGNHINTSRPVDIKEVAGRFTTDIIASVAFGLNSNTLKDPENEFRKYGKMFFQPSFILSFKRTLNLAFPKICNMLKMKKYSDELEHFFIKLIRDTVDYREQNNIKRNDFLQLLINIRNGEGSGDEKKEDLSKMFKQTIKSLSIEQIAAQSFLFFLAGFETSSSTIAYFFYDMATHQDIQDRVRTEINQMLDRYNGEITYDGILECQYLDQAINECFRLHAFIPLHLRRCTKDYVIPDTDVLIEKGTMVFIPVLGFQSDPEYYPEPEKFDPDRFSPEEKQKRHPYTFLPFGEGPRNCIGVRFGLLETKVGIISLLRNHRFTVNDKTQRPFKMDPKNLILAVKGEIWLNVEKV